MKKRESKKFSYVKDLEEFLKKEKADLHLKGFKRTDKTVKDFLNNMLNIYNYKYETWKGKNFDTGTGRYRSIQDLYSLTMKYFPDTDFETFIRSIFDLCEENEITGLWLCTTIDRYVFRGGTNNDDPWTVRDDQPYDGADYNMDDVYRELGYQQHQFENYSYEEDDDDWDDDDDDN